jgi:hypothetical protein
MLIGHATDVVQQRAFVQESADSIALAAVIGGHRAANALEDILHVSITQLDLTENEAVVHVRVGQFTATSFASHGG